MKIHILKGYCENEIQNFLRLLSPLAAEPFLKENLI